MSPAHQGMSMHPTCHGMHIAMKKMHRWDKVPGCA